MRSDSRFSVGPFLLWRALLAALCLRVGVPRTPVEAGLFAGTVAAALGNPVAMLGTLYPGRFRNLAADGRTLGYRRAAREVHAGVVDSVSAA